MDKLLHFIVYGVLAILFYRAFATLPIDPGSRKRLLFAILAATLYGVGDEIHQLFISSRSAECLDVAADGLGAFFFGIGFRYFVNR